MLIIVLALLMVLAWLLVTKKIRFNKWTWEDDVIMAAKTKRTRKNLRRIAEDNPKLFVAAKNISRIK
jgi:hypothetical protein